MTNAEKFKEVFGFKLKNIGSYEDGYYCIDSDADIECKTCPLYEKGCSHVAFINWWNSEYKGEVKDGVQWYEWKPTERKEE